MPSASEASQLSDLLHGARAVLLTGPEDPDGDSLGACLALARAIRTMTGARVDVAGHANFRYAWMPGAVDLLDDQSVPQDYDLAIVLDGDRHRLTPRVTEVFGAATKKAIVDHHGTASEVGYDLAIIERDAPSTCEMVLELMDSWQVALDRDTAALLYAGMLFDTGGFRYSNTSSDTLRAAARLLDQGIDHATIAIHVLMERRPAGMRLKARVMDSATFHNDGTAVQGAASLALHTELGTSEADVEGIVDALLYVAGVEVAVLLVERAPDKVKLSLRSRGLVDVSRIARGMHPSGGGHPKAAGVNLTLSLAEVQALLPVQLAEAVAQARISAV
jgi:bifunctional oligoribonuclease and PAP phosphatase NrnA